MPHGLQSFLVLCTFCSRCTGGFVVVNLQQAIAIAPMPLHPQSSDLVITTLLCRAEDTSGCEGLARMGPWALACSALPCIHPTPSKQATKTPQCPTSAMRSGSACGSAPCTVCASATLTSWASSALRILVCQTTHEQCLQLLAASRAMLYAQVRCSTYALLGVRATHEAKLP